MDDATFSEIGRGLRLIEALKEMKRHEPAEHCGTCSDVGWTVYARNSNGTDYHVECLACGNPKGHPNPTPKVVSYAADDMETIRRRMKELEEDARTARIATEAKEMEDATGMFAF